MKQVMIPFLLAFATPMIPAIAYGWEDQEVPPTEPEDPNDSIAAILWREDTARFDQIIHNYKTLDVFAGAVNEIIFRGVCYVVDRSSEQRKIAPSAGTLAAGAAATAGLVKDLKVRSGGKVMVRIAYREFDKTTGKMTSELSFDVSMDGAFQIDMGGFDDAMGKQHK